jgi:hypothetical protein
VRALPAACGGVVGDRNTAGQRRARKLDVRPQARQAEVDVVVHHRELYGPPIDTGQSAGPARKSLRRLAA